MRLKSNGNLNIDTIIVDAANNSPKFNVANTTLHNLKEGQSLGATTKMRIKNKEVLISGQMEANNLTIGTNSHLNVNGHLSINNCARECPVGTILMFAGLTAPNNGWLICDGGAVSRTTYSVLFSLIGTTFGIGDGSTTFNLPNFHEKHPLGADTVNNINIGNTGGQLEHNHSIPAHTHNFNHTHNGGTLANHEHVYTHNHVVNHDHIVTHNHHVNHAHMFTSHSHTGSVGSGGSSTIKKGISASAARAAHGHASVSVGSINTGSNWTYSRCDDKTYGTDTLSLIGANNSGVNLHTIATGGISNGGGEGSMIATVNSANNTMAYLKLRFMIRVF